MTFPTLRRRSWLGLALFVVKRLQARMMSLALERSVSLPFIRVFLGLSLHCSALAFLGCIDSRNLVVRGCFSSRFSIFRWPHSGFVLRILLLELPRTEQRVNFTVSEDPNLFVCQGSLDAIGIVSQVIVFDAVLGVRFRCRCDQRRRMAWEVLCLEGL